MFTSFTRVVKFALQNFWRNIWLSVITITVLVLTLLLVNIVVVLQVLGATAVQSVEDRIDVTVALIPGVSDQTTGDIRSYLTGLAQVREVTLVSPESALEAFRQRHAASPQILRSIDELGSNPFGPTLIVHARSASDYPFILESLANPTYQRFIQDKNFTDHQAIISRINAVTDRFARFGLILAAFFAAIAVLIIMNTIRVAIYTYREEIGIMKLVGASNWFVRAPFLLEGVLVSALAVVVASLVTLPIVRVVEPSLQRFFETTPVGLTSFLMSHGASAMALELAGLVALTIASSFIAIGRYLKT